jgi:hypothetical protein
MNIALYSPAMQSGKSTISNHLIMKYNYTKIILAKTLKSMLEIFLKDLGYAPKNILRMIYGDLKEVIIPEIGKTPRQLMQTLGTEWARECVGENIWIKIACSNLNNIMNYVTEDVRFLNEANSFREAGFKIIKIIRPSAKITSKHSSEGSLDNYNFDYTIENNGTLDELFEKMDGILNGYQK